jgi:TolB-like protein
LAGKRLSKILHRFAKNGLLLLSILFLLQGVAGCSAGLLTRRIQVQPSGQTSPSGNTALVTIQFRAFSGHTPGDKYLSDLEQSIRNGIFNSGQFREVHLKGEKTKQEYDIFFEVAVIPVDNGKIKWGISWPAVYPMPLYWPLQQKEGFAEVLLSVKVRTALDQINEFSIRKETPYYIHLYGFFRTGPIEDALQKSYYEAIDELTQKVREMSLEYAGTKTDELKTKPGNKKNIAVLDLEAVSVTLSEARTLTDKLRGELVRTAKFQVIERSQMEDILTEQGFQQTGLCNTNECYVEAGKLLGVEQMIGGSIGKVGNIYLISIRLIDVETGLIVKLVDEEIEGSIDELLKTGIRSVALRMSR